MEDMFWGKKKETGGRYCWLPLRQHLTDTAGVALCLFNEYVGGGVRKEIESGLSSPGHAEELVMFLGAVHDIGKATPAFQIKPCTFGKGELDIGLLENLERAGYTGISGLKLTEPAATPHSLVSQELLRSYGVNDETAVIIGGHHGKTADLLQNSYNSVLVSYSVNIFQSDDKKSDIYRKWQNAQRDIFEFALEISGFADERELPRISKPAQVLLLGLIIMADWIASNEEYFPLVEWGEKACPDQTARLENAFYKWQKTALWDAETPDSAEALFKRRFGFEPNEIQRKLVEVITAVKAPGLIILEAPMGLGKTEAALAGAEVLAQKNARCGVYFGLPTQATSNGIFPRIKGWLESIAKEEGLDKSIRLSHGKAYLNDEFRSLTDGVDWDSKEGNVIINEWFSGRKTAALDDFVVGTVDSFLMASLKTRHLALRHLGFARKAVIIDEVHAYDAYMSEYLKESVEWMGAYGVPVIILSATLPAEKRVEIAQAYIEGRRSRKTSASDSKPKADTEQERREAAERRRKERAEREAQRKQLLSAAYPLITYTDELKIKQLEDFHKSEQKNVRIKRITEDNLISEVNELIRDGGNIGIIVNTVKRAQEFGRSLAEKFGEDTVEVLHSGFIAAERVRKEAGLLERVGKNAERPWRSITVGTQVIEQSLDIDFDVLISDLCPMDLLMQRIGRLHRHDIKRPEKHTESVAYVIDCGKDGSRDFEQGGAAVYGRYLLARTREFLPDAINIPSDISKLVQKVYDFTVPAASAEEYKHEHLSRIDTKKSRAVNYRICSPGSSESNSLLGWTANQLPGDTEEKSYAQVRDITDSIEVIMLKETGNGYGIIGSDENLAEHISEPHIAREISKNTITLPREFSYETDKSIEELERYYLKKLYDWKQSPWLSGALGIILDKKNDFKLGRYIIHYDEKYGISSRREDESR